MRRLAAALGVVLAVSCGAAAPLAPVRASEGAPSSALDVGALQSRYAAFTLEDARRSGYAPDGFCLDAAAFGRPKQLGAMGFHATNEALLRGPIAVERPQALVFDAGGRMIAVEYEITTDAALEAPSLFGRTFSKVPSHMGVMDEHYALHVWFVPNPGGQFADFNPSLACPVDSSPAPMGTHDPGMPMNQEEQH